MLTVVFLQAQEKTVPISGRIVNEKGFGIEMVVLGIKNSSINTQSDEKGNFRMLVPSQNAFTLIAQQVGHKKEEWRIEASQKKHLILIMHELNEQLEEIVVTGTLKEISKSESPINIDIVTPKLMQKTAVPNLFEATALVNGVKPQINCNVCNTGDIHINGMEGPYTLVLIDGMPIVSGLSSVYGLMGIPTGMMERLEIAKGPASSLYGSEAMGGTINLITKNPSSAPRLFTDFYTSSYGENNLDVSLKVKPAKRINWLIGANGFYFNRTVDKNLDGFTDVALQKRISIFNKLNFERESQKEFSIAFRYVNEDRWGGQTNWTKEFRGGDSVYGESVLVQRAELISKYEWPTKENIVTQVSYNSHLQNSVYGISPFLAKQSTSFLQNYWTKDFNARNKFLLGMSLKNIWFDDNTLATAAESGSLNKPDVNQTYGLFVQNESILDSLSKHKLLLGLRLDYESRYGLINSPRIAYKWSPHYRFIFRANFGTGFRVVNVFTEDHAALTGSRDVVFVNEINPERSYNTTLNLLYKMKLTPTSLIVWDGNLFYYYFTNKIVADYDTDPNKIIYNNLNGFAFSRGGALNASSVGTGNFKLNVGVTFSDVQNVKTDSVGQKKYTWQIQTPKWSGNFVLSYAIPRFKCNVDVTGNWYGIQRLPVQINDYRPEYSSKYLLLNFQLSKYLNSNFET